ncbi:MAG: hypothetical protein QS748_01340 [Candidatus Endonucleobacter bathymodioli]|uniref:Uncharacterized protein n=1 Tax=Candidatus Endonucleibacter bathymodioli TaxID=539814 RepID=A0AA90SS24_9GAMM|nr:hypothetical protein [Candidatus Endonucleobacter bathymodioli]
MQKTTTNGRWETDFDELRKEYQHLKDGPSLPTSQQSSLVIKNIDDFIDTTHQMKKQLESSNTTPMTFHRFLQKIDTYIDSEQARLDNHRSTMKSEDSVAMGTNL